MRNKKGEEQRNLYEMIPRPLVSYEINTEGLFILHRPKINNTFLRNILPRKFRQAVFKIRLDELGTAVWKKIDGVKNAGQIAEELESEHGDKMQPVVPRLSKFLVILKNAKLIEY